MISTTVYCTVHEVAEEVRDVDEIHRFPVEERQIDGEARATGEYAVEIQGRLECGRAVHFIGSIGWWG